jgi:acyl-coenzyme A synthetase/AMP-(fatty) acid ligase
VPSTIEFIENLPKTAVGKVLRCELKEGEEVKEK